MGKVDIPFSSKEQSLENKHEITTNPLDTSESYNKLTKKSNLGKINDKPSNVIKI